MRTFCFGRFLIDLPAGTSVKAGYKFAGDEVVTIKGVSTNKFAAIVQARATELSEKQHRVDGAMLVSNTALDENATVLTSWAKPSSRLAYLQDLYVHLPDHGVAYHIRGESRAAQQSQALDYLRSVRQSIRFRAVDEIPTTPGFCIDMGLIARSRLNEEEMSIGLRPVIHPGAAVTLTSYVTANPDRELLARTSSLPAEYQQIDARMVKLRRGDHNVGPIRGQEILGRAQQGATRGYAFLWESQGEARSLGAPFLSLEMTTDKRAPQEEPPFQGDEDALAFWDRLLDRLRLRPGAI